MKKVLFSIIAVMACVAVYAQAGEVSVTGMELERRDGRVAASFEVNVGKKATKSRYNLILKPTLVKGQDSFELPNIVVQGRRARIADKRHTMAAGVSAYAETTVFARNGQSFTYMTEFPVQEWMAGSDLVFDAVSAGCCSAQKADSELIAENVLWSEPYTEYFTIIEEIPVDTGLTTGDRLALRHSFIVPITELAHPDLFDSGMPLNLPGQAESEGFIDQNRDGSLSIYFKQAGRVIDRYFANNNKSLVDIVSSVREIERSPDSKIVGIVIAGFASPEGTLEYNDRLAWDRAVALKEFIKGNTGVDPSIINIYNGAVDWGGLRNMVAASDMKDRDTVLYIIDNVPVWDSRRETGRRIRLMQLNGGETYRYMMTNFFPQLRQAAYIKVYYENN